MLVLFNNFIVFSSESIKLTNSQKKTTVPYIVLSNPEALAQRLSWFITETDVSQMYEEGKLLSMQEQKFYLTP